jgi:L-amino acid N-acyltransferase YncA
MNLIRCDDSYLEPIREIINQAIVNSTAIYDYQPRTPETMAAWFATKRQGDFPVLGAMDEQGQFMGFGSYGRFRAWPGYKYTVEHSLYVAERFRGRGVGKRLLQELITTARQQQYHVLIGGIDAENVASRKLHEAFAFNHAGTIRQAGYKFGRWLDLAFYQLILDTPAKPEEG